MLNLLNELHGVLKAVPVSYTHLDVYKRQILHGSCAADDLGDLLRNGALTGAVAL